MKTKHRILILALAALLLSGTAVPAFAVETTSPVTVTVDGKTVAFPDQQPVIRDSRTLVPVRFIAEALGYDVDWNPTDNTAVIDGGRVILYIDTDQAILNGNHVKLDTKSLLIGDRTMIPIRIVAETLGCTVDWIEETRTVQINSRLPDGREMGVFDRLRQSGLFWYSANPQSEYLIRKSSFASPEEAMAGRKWWIERPLDKSRLTNPDADCSIVMKSFLPEDLAQVRSLFYMIYPTRYDDACDILMRTIKGEIWQTFYEESSRWYPLYAAMPPRSGTFGSHYYDDREVEMYCNSTCTEVRIQISAEGHANPEIPRTLTAEEIEFYTAQAKQKYMLGLWGLE